MPSTIENLRSSFSKDVARQSRFDVTIQMPTLLQGLYSVETTKGLSLRCESTELPSRTFSTVERKIGAVPTQKYAYQSVYNDLSMTFIMSGDMKEKIIFDNWMEIVNPKTNFLFNYKNNYVGKIGINQYSISNELIYQATLIDAFPIAVNQLDLDWSSDNYHKLTVVFAYTYWVKK